MVEIRYLEEVANSFLFEGLKKEKNIEKKRIYFAVSWGFNRYLERVNFMIICTNLLRTTNLNEKEIKFYQELGSEIVISSLDIVETIE